MQTADQGPEPSGGTGAPQGSGSAAGGAGIATRASTGELVVALGAGMIVVVSHLLGDVVLDEYVIGLTTWLACMAVLVLVAARLTGTPLPGGSGALLAVVALATVMGVWEFLADVDSGNAGALTWIFRLATWVATGILGVGLVLLARRRDALDA